MLSEEIDQSLSTALVAYSNQFLAVKSVHDTSLCLYMKAAGGKLRELEGNRLIPHLKASSVDMVLPRHERESTWCMRYPIDCESWIRIETHHGQPGCKLV